MTQLSRDAQRKLFKAFRSGVIIESYIHWSSDLSDEDKETFKELLRKARERNNQRIKEGTKKER